MPKITRGARATNAGLPIPEKIIPNPPTAPVETPAEGTHQTSTVETPTADQSTKNVPSSTAPASDVVTNDAATSEPATEPTGKVQAQFVPLEVTREMIPAEEWVEPGPPLGRGWGWCQCCGGWYWY